MALGTGQLSLADIAGEYGGSAPHALSEYYSKGNAPGSGEIQIHADFQGTSNIYAFTISSNTTNLNMRAAAVSAGWDQSAILAVTINSGVVIYGTSTGSYGMVINGSLPSGTSLTNNGTILGKGGAGGSSAGNRNCEGASATRTTGYVGGPALQIATAVTITNNGRISGGGGGGGVGGQYGNRGTPGGGGGGTGNGAGGVSQHAGNGTAGSLTGGGSGGAGYTFNNWSCPGGSYAGAGGAGGGYGAAGATGGSSHGAGTSGGGAGAATSGASNVTWGANGTRNGSVG